MTGRRRGQAPDTYHLEQLRLAREAATARDQQPPGMPAGARILDVGCGAGQLLIARYPDRRTFAIDVDAAALALGHTLATSIDFTRGMAEALPFKDSQFDLAIARVSLPYTDITRSVGEIHRVLRPGGVAWLTLHPLSRCWSLALHDNWKSKLFFFYVLANGLTLLLVGRQFAIGRYQESFQTSGRMRRVLARAGFSNIQITKGVQFLVTATK